MKCTRCQETLPGHWLNDQGLCWSCQQIVNAEEAAYLQAERQGIKEG